MIYLDNSAGSHPKPLAVAAALTNALSQFGANPGRGCYAMTRCTEEMVEQARCALAAFIQAPDASRLVFTAGATMSANMAIAGLLQPGDHVVCSSMEHNAVFRPLAIRADRGEITLTVVQADYFGYLEADSVAAAVRPETRLIAITHASNVCGSVQPIAEIGQAAQALGVPLLVDAAQSAGLLPISVTEMGISLLLLAGHKALYGPPGVGALWVAPTLDLMPLLAGGTGTESELRHQPAAYPMHLEAGSLNTAGIAALHAGLNFVTAQGVERLYTHAHSVLARIESGLRQLPGVFLQKKEKESRPRVPVLSFTVTDHDANEIAEKLDQRGIACRAGYHCAPLAHRTLGTFDEGTVRLSPGYANTLADADACVDAIWDLIRRG